jgi:hypothetical protein
MAQYTDNASTEQIVTFACYFFHLKLLSTSSVSASRRQETEKALHQMSPREAVNYLDEKLRGCKNEYLLLIFDRRGTQER